MSPITRSVVAEIGALNITPTYRKTFDLIFERAKNEEWRALGDDVRTFVLLNPEATMLELCQP